MGSFYATCSITDLSLTYDDPTYIQLIVPLWIAHSPYKTGTDNIEEKGLRVTNEGAVGEYAPFGFPIEGKYDDYGQIKDIVRDRNVLMLEEFFNINIDDIIECASDDRWYRYGIKNNDKSWMVGENKMKHLNILKYMTTTYFRKEHYDYLSSDLLLDDNWWIDDIKKERLPKMKKALVELEKAKSIHIPKNEEYTIKDITEQDIEDASFWKYFEENMSLEEKKKHLVKIKNFVENHELNAISGKFYIPSICSINMFEYLPLTQEDYEQVVKQYFFIINMHGLYKVIRPSHYGSQTSNHSFYVKFHKFSIELMGEQVKMQDKENFKEEINYLFMHKMKDIDENVKEKIYQIITRYLDEK